MITDEQIMNLFNIDGSKEFRIKMKKMWYEHVKRRPSIDEGVGRKMKYAPDELRIINTPLDELMNTFEKSI